MSEFSSMYPVVEVKRLDPEVELPRFGREGDAGSDLYCMDDVEIAPQGMVMVHSGIAVSIPRGFEGTLRPRSGMATKRGITLANTPSTIDSNYRGERVCQLLIKLQPEPQFVEVDEFSEPTTNRGDKGFGSSGYGRL